MTNSTLHDLVTTIGIDLGKNQGCSVLRLGQAIGEQAVEAEGIGVDRLAHVGGAVGAQDVERERADPVAILVQDTVAHVIS